MSERPPQLEMLRDTLDGLAETAAPEGYRIRAYREGDAAAWCRVISAGIGGDRDEAGFWKSIGAWGEPDLEGLFFAEQDGMVVGTACAARRPSLLVRTGYVHMVAVDPGHRGHGVGRGLMLAVLHRFRLVGCTRATLHTDDWRLPAIRLYLKLGFHPRLAHESHEARWRDVYRNLGRPADGAS